MSWQALLHKGVHPDDVQDIWGRAVTRTPGLG